MDKLNLNRLERANALDRVDFYGVSRTIAVCLLPDGDSYLRGRGNDAGALARARLRFAR